MDVTSNPGIGPTLAPGGTAARRPVLVPFLLVAAGTLGLGLGLLGQPLQERRVILAGVAALSNLASALAMFARAGWCPGEARGWRLLGASLVLLTLGNLAAGLAFLHPAQPAGWIWVPLGLGVGSQVLAGAGLLLLPWHGSGLRLRARNIPGSLLFTGSILLILLTFMDWEGSFGVHHLINLATAGAFGRLLILGSITLMLLEHDLRRIRGVLGFVLVHVFLGAIFLGFLQNRLAHGWIPAPVLTSVYGVAPLVLGLAAWSRAPLEFPAQALESNRIWEFIPYTAFALAVAAILYRFLVDGTLARIPMLGLVSLTVFLLLRQFMLLRDLRRQNQSLERRVKERTRDLETMQAAVLRTERLNTLATLGAGIAHDLNNFLTVIRTSLDLLEQGPDRRPAAEDPHLARIQASAERAAALTGRLLSFARKDPRPPERLDLAAELAHLEDLLRMLLPGSIRLLLELAGGPFPVLTRKSSLEQILVNLVSNAKDAMPGGGTVTLRLEAAPGPDGSGCRLRVQDTGPGMPPEVQAHLFEPFITTKAEGKGTGLGLATVKHLVESDGGTVQVHSSPDSGCRFLITYPRA
jgi:signal transduction histidine kinase